MQESNLQPLLNHSILAGCWTWAGDAAPERGDGASPLDIRTRIDAVAAAGWQGVGLNVPDLRRLSLHPTLPVVRKMLSDHGIDLVELEFLSDWWWRDGRREASDETKRLLFDAAQVLGARTIKVGGRIDLYGSDTYVDPTLFADEFLALGDEASARGLRIALEPMAFSNVPDLIAGAKLVNEVKNPAAGLAVDAWHAFRANIPFPSLASLLSPEYIFQVEISDAAEHPTGTLWDDTVDRRMWPGDGDMDTAAFVVEMYKAGWRGHWGVEIISEPQRTLPIHVAVGRTAEKARLTLGEAEKRLRDLA